MHIQAVELNNEDYPPGFLEYVQPDGTLSTFDKLSLGNLLFAPKYYPNLIDSGPNRNGPESKILLAIPVNKRKFLNHTASVLEWKNEVKNYLNHLNKLLTQGTKIDRMAVLNDVVLMDILAVTANQRAHFEVEGESEIYDSSDTRSIRPGSNLRHLNLKRFLFTDECIDHIHAIQNYVLANQGRLPQSPLRERATFTLSGGPERTVKELMATPHYVGVELITKMHHGTPKTVILCVGSTVSSTVVAAELKAKLDIQDVRHVTVLVVNGKTQKGMSDCPIYSIFHTEKYRTAESNGTFDEVLTNLFDDISPHGSYRILWGRPDGARVYYIEDDNQPESRILPPFILKEMQGRDTLKKLIDARGWNTLTVNKKEQTLLERYASHYRQTSDHEGWPTSIAEKRIKYFERALDLLEKIQSQYDPDAAQDLLNTLLTKVRAVHFQESSVTDMADLRVSHRIRTIHSHIEQRKQRIALLEAANELEEDLHQLYLLDKVHPAENSDDGMTTDEFSSDDDDLSDTDRNQIEAYRNMDRVALGKVENELEKNVKTLRETIASIQEEYGISIRTLKMENIALKEETMRLGTLERSLSGLQAMQSRQN